MISDDSMWLYILGGLGPEYESVVVTLTNRTKHLTLQDLQFSLQSHEMNLQSIASTNLDTIQANVGNLSIQSNSRGNSRGSKPYMNREGRSRLLGRVYGRGNRVVRQLCGRMGHTVQRCYQRFDIHYEGPGAPDDTNNASNTPNPHAYVIEAQPTRTTSSDWFLDIGATNHMVNNMEQVRDPVDYKAKAKVTVGNGQSLSIKHSSYQSLHAFLPDQPLLLKDILHVPSITKNFLRVSSLPRAMMFL